MQLFIASTALARKSATARLFARMTNGERVPIASSDDERPGISSREGLREQAVEASERLRHGSLRSLPVERAAESVRVLNSPKPAMAMVPPLASASSDRRKQGEACHGSKETLHGSLASNPSRGGWRSGTRGRPCQPPLRCASPLRRGDGVRRGSRAAHPCASPPLSASRRLGRGVSGYLNPQASAVVPIVDQRPPFSPQHPCVQIPLRTLPSASVRSP